MLKFNKKSGGKFAQQIKEVLYKEILQINFFFKNPSLGWVAQLVECHPMLQKVVGSIPDEGTYPV